MDTPDTTIDGKRIVRHKINGEVQMFIEASDGTDNLITYDPSEAEVNVNWKTEDGTFKHKEIAKKVSRTGNGILMGTHVYETDTGERKVAICKWVKTTYGWKNRGKIGRRIDFTLKEKGTFDTVLAQLQELGVLDQA